MKTVNLFLFFSMWTISFTSAATILNIHEDFGLVPTINGMQNKSMGIFVEIPIPSQNCTFEYVYDRTELTEYYSLPFDASLDNLKGHLFSEPDLYVSDDRDALRNGLGLCKTSQLTCPSGSMNTMTNERGCTREYPTNSTQQTAQLPTQQTTQVPNKCGNIDSGTCDPVNKPKKCVNGSWIDSASKCGCPEGYGGLGDMCGCTTTAESTFVCDEKTNVTEYENITYVFDGGYNVTATEPYTFETQICYPAMKYFGGKNCSEVINTTKTGAGYNAFGEPVLKYPIQFVQCSRCPSICERKPPVNVTCGACVCPENKGFCDSLGERSNISEIPVYCINELWLPQKVDKQTCQNNFECLSNFCSKGECYDVRLNVEKQANIIDRILNWIKRLFGLNI